MPSRFSRRSRHRNSLKIKELLSQAKSLTDEYEQCSEIGCIEEAIELDRQALSLCTPGHPLRAMCLQSLSAHIWYRYNKLGGTQNINEAIDIEREALSLCPAGHPERSWMLTNLANSLFIRYGALCELPDLSEAICLDREALSLCPSGHPLRSTPLNNLAIRVSIRYDRQGAVEDLMEAIDLNREALSLRPPGHLLRSASLNNLALRLSGLYDRRGAVEDLTEAIDLNREALSLRPPGHPSRSMSLNNLASDLSTRYDRQGAVDDLMEAIDLIREALFLRPPGHALRSSSLNNLAIHLSSWYDRNGAIKDLVEAIDLNREALSLYPPGHPNRSLSLNNLATHLSARYDRQGVVEDLLEAIVLDREALSLCPPGHPERPYSLTNLANRLCTQYFRQGEVKYLTEAINLDREALSLRPFGHPEWSSSLGNLAIALKNRYTQLHMPEDEREIFELYSELARDMPAVSSNDLSVAKAWANAAEEFRHSTTLLAYQTALGFLVSHVTALPSLPRHLSLLKSLASSLAVDALSAHLRNTSPMGAIELLEQGRAVFWSQLIRLRSPLDDVVASGSVGKELAEEYIRLTSGIHEALSSSGENQYDKVWHLKTDLEKTISSIRQLPGLSRFLLPPLFSDLQLAADDGPVIIVNASQYGCDALILSVGSGPVRVPLSITKKDVEGLTSRLCALTLRAKKEDVTRELSIFLRALWDQVVSPIFCTLERKYPLGSRVWWCPTSEFSRLPLHAANPYRKNKKSFSDLYISSYTPSLSALIRARRSTPSPSGQQKRFIAIGQANAIGTSQLYTVGAELANTKQCLDSHSTFSCVEGQDATISRVTKMLSKNEWVHLACHGIAYPERPFESAFALHDGRLTIDRIAQMDLQDAEFAYLSACHTTVGDKESPDESIHLAGAMQFAGFRSVIGTMWAVDDGQAVKVTSAFYKNMLEECGGLDHTRAAYALWKTMRTVRGVTLDQRILYVHIGV